MPVQFSVYGLIQRDRRMLLVRRTRGPYAGQLDLPGGCPGPSDRDQRMTLERKLLDETGLAVHGTGQWLDFEFVVTRDSAGREIDLIHSGVWTIAKTKLHPSRASMAPAQSANAEACVWIETAGWYERADLSMPVHVVLAAADWYGLLDLPAAE